MSSKHNSGGGWKGPRRLPSVREKLSGFVQRGRGLAKKTTLSVLGEPRERPSLDESQKAFPRVQVQDFGTSSLEIDLQSLEAFRIAPGEEEEEDKQAEQPKRKSEVKSSATPIADLFARKAAAVEPVAPVNASFNKSSASLISSYNPRRILAEERQPEKSSSNTAQQPSEVLTVRIVNSSHAQPHTSKPWPPPEAPRAVGPIRTQRVSAITSDSKQPGSIQIHHEPRRAAFAPSRLTSITTSGPISRARQHDNFVAEQQKAENRYSTPISLPSSTTPANPPPAGPVQTDRRRSWQPSPSPSPSLPPSASAPYRNAVPNRRASSRLPADRLGWIKELEEGKKNRPTINSDLPVLRTMQGSVADKLARFESKQMQAHMAPMTRSNSTKSRTSSIADTTFSSYGGVATTRSSLDSHRTSSVFSHYDDSFREKMELIAAGPKSEGVEEKPVLTKVTTSFMSVERRTKQACIEKPQEV